MQRLGNLKNDVEDIITRIGIKYRKSSNAGESSTIKKTSKEQSKEIDSPVEDSKTRFIPEDIFESIMKISFRDLAQQLLNPKDLFLISDPHFLSTQRISFQTIDLLYRYELLSAEDLKSLFHMNEVVNHAAYNMVTSFARLHNIIGYGRPLIVKSIFDSWYSSHFRNIYEGN
jgi:hypothetical protein